MKPQAVHRRHRRLLALHRSKFPRQQHQRIRVIGVHVLDDTVRRVRQRIGLPAIVILRGHPAHHAESAHVVNVHHLQAIKCKILEVHPVFAVRIALQVPANC
jgi:hypothetical protein